jgi:hypothetical protein
MTRRKGEISQRSIDKSHPHQVAMPSRITEGKALTEVLAFGQARSLAPRRPCFFRNHEYWTVWCFAEQEDAEAFRERFGGEVMAPADRPRWPG